MKKAGIVAFIVFLTSCGPVEESPWPFYELVYSTTVQVHKHERLLQAQIEELLSTQRNDSVFYEAHALQTIADSNQALIARIEYAINVLSNTPDDRSYSETKEAAIRMLHVQQVYHTNSVYALIRACDDGVITGNEKMFPGAARDSYVTVNNTYTQWKLLRDQYILNLGLTEAELTNLRLRYGSD